jgi:hypothetical protein
MMLNILYALTGLATALAGLNIAQFFSFRAQKKKITAEAQQQENTADMGKFDNLEKEITFLGRLVDKYREETTAQGEQLRFKQQGYERQLKGIQKLLSKEVSKKRYAEYRICENLLCTDRKPTLGEFHTEDSEITQNEVV